MREIKFRAKAIEDFDTQIEGIEKGDWVYGYYYFDRDNECGIIITALQQESGGVGSGIMQCHVKVDYKTVGQFTGLLDKNKKEIYGEDILRNNYPESEDAVVVFNEGGYNIEDSEGIEETIDLVYEVSEVIGNIYDNPELNEVAK